MAAVHPDFADLLSNQQLLALETFGIRRALHRL
jgi:hypothetical protein